jgi:hypothetical protein
VHCVFTVTLHHSTTKLFCICILLKGLWVITWPIQMSRMPMAWCQSHVCQATVRFPWLACTFIKTAAYFQNKSYKFIYAKTTHHVNYTRHKYSSLALFYYILCTNRHFVKFRNLSHFLPDLDKTLNRICRFIKIYMLIFL